MAYIPPHKRHLKDEERPSPSPASLVRQIKKNLNLGPKSSSQKRKDQHALAGGKYIYARDSISRWWIVGLTDDGQCPNYVQLEAISCEPIEQRRGEKPLALVRAYPSEEVNEIVHGFGKSPWLSITEKILPDLHTGFQNVSSEMQLNKSEKVKASFVARFGKLFLFGGPSISVDTICRSAASESTYMNQVKRSFYTNVPEAFVQDVQRVIVPNIELSFEAEREHYLVKVQDKSRPDSTISCRCAIIKDGGKLKIHKIELNQVRHLVADISCISKDLDLRLMLSTKRILTELTDEEEHGMTELIKSAVIDPDVKGGLRWPRGKDFFGDRFCVVGIWHTKYKAFKGPNMKLKIRHADRFDFGTSKGEVTREVTMKMTGLVKQLRDGIVETGPITEMLQEELELIWNNFLSCKCSFT
ncbi:uncharacterized protein LOC143889820 [Tasmannia lanceolata]|uniref:uncharacterized protein LOC143889820 n=1 Tax=Tasmannia lanceolata TaxID=3420 RepID=UPI004063D1AA